MNDSLRRTVWSLAAILAITTFPCIVFAEPKVDEPAPSLSVDELLGAPADASTEWDKLKGKVVVVEFWTTWCAPCIASIPHLNELAEQFVDRDVVFISLTNEPRETVEAFLKRKPITGWVALDTDKQAAKAYGVTVIPHTFIVGRDGRILAQTNPGQLQAEHIERALRNEPLGLEPHGDGDVVPLSPRELVYGNSFKPGRFPGVGFEKNELPEPLAQVIVRPALDPEGDSSGGSMEHGQTWINCDAAGIVSSVYHRAYSGCRVDLKAELPQQKLDVAIWAPKGDPLTFRRLAEAGIGGAFGLTAHTEEREVDVLLLEATDAVAKKLPLTVSNGGSSMSTRREQDHKIASYINGTPDQLARLLESQLKTPVIDLTGLALGFDFEFTIPDDVESAQKNLDQLGLKLVPGRRRLDYVVIENTAAE